MPAAPTDEQGDAFTFTPEVEQGGGGAGGGEAAGWMVSDVIAYPERVTELLERWCGGGWAQRMVVTMKFQGDTPDWGELQVRNSANFATASSLVCALYGGINFQIEHHLFPTLCHVRYKSIQPIVRAPGRQRHTHYDACIYGMSHKTTHKSHGSFTCPSQKLRPA